MFSIKICGITCVDDALAAMEAGADALGLNFYPPSARYISVEVAEQIRAVTPSSCRLVGVFVDHSVEAIGELVRVLGLDLVQLHGDQSLEFIAQLDSIPVLRAFRLQPGDEVNVRRFVSQFAGKPLVGALMDASVPGQWGGSGERADWDAVARLANDWPSYGGLLVLAGGLTPGNVTEAIRWARPTAVDTASGVELAGKPTRKDPQKMLTFVQAARAAFERSCLGSTKFGTE